MSKEIDRLIEVAEILRGENGCPWDKEQTHRSTLNDLLEECYEYFDAVHNEDHGEMKEEIGDLLWLVVFQCQLARESKKFDINEAAKDVVEKLIRRHPHIFGDSDGNLGGEGVQGATAKPLADNEEILRNWEKIKLAEKGKENRKSVLDGIPNALPALYKAEKIQTKVARYGFDWNNVLEPLKKVEEEIREFREAIENGKTTEEKTLEFGDILFALVNVARHSNISAEDALRATIAKFSRRFNYIEKHFDFDITKLREAGLEKLDELWNEAKTAE